MLQLTSNGILVERGAYCGILVVRKTARRIWSSIPRMRGVSGRSFRLVSFPSAMGRSCVRVCISKPSVTMRGVPFANKLFVVDVVDELKLTCFLVSKFYVCTTG